MGGLGSAYASRLPVADPLCAVHSDRATTVCATAAAAARAKNCLLELNFVICTLSSHHHFNTNLKDARNNLLHDICEDHRLELPSSSQFSMGSMNQKSKRSANWALREKPACPVIVPKLLEPPLV
jgi:hypothetical protein